MGAPGEEAAEATDEAGGSEEATALADAEATQEGTGGVVTLLT